MNNEKDALEWRKVHNNDRLKLIEKKYGGGGLSSEEETHLERLQKEAEQMASSYVNDRRNGRSR